MFRDWTAPVVVTREITASVMYRAFRLFSAMRIAKPQQMGQ
jgi:hypothetical protein